MGTKTNRSLQAKADKRKAQIAPLRLEASFKSFEHARSRERETVVGN